MIQSGSCYSHTQQQADTAGTATATAVGCTDPATVVACLRNTPAGRLLDVTPQNLVALPFALVRGTPTLPPDPAQAVAAGQFARVPVVNGTNRDEGRSVTTGYIGATREQYIAWVRDNFGADTDAVLAHYPWPANPDRFTAAYLIGAVITDSGVVSGIGGCAYRRLTRDHAISGTTWRRATPMGRRPVRRPVGPTACVHAGMAGPVGRIGSVHRPDLAAPGGTDELPGNEGQEGSEQSQARHRLP
jgi:para-nitrobenzyl esterase